jgi:hypothetical protein
VNSYNDYPLDYSQGNFSIKHDEDLIIPLALRAQQAAPRGFAFQHFFLTLLCGLWLTRVQAASAGGDGLQVISCNPLLYNPNPVTFCCSSCRRRGRRQVSCHMLCLARAPDPCAARLDESSVRCSALRPQPRPPSRSSSYGIDRHKGTMRNSGKPGCVQRLTLRCECCLTARRMLPDDDIHEAYAVYLSKYVAAYTAAGVNVTIMTIQVHHDHHNHHHLILLLLHQHTLSCRTSPIPPTACSLSPTPGDAPPPPSHHPLQPRCSV